MVPDPQRSSKLRPGDTIPLGGKTLRVVGLREDDAEQPPVLIVEEQ
jgi:hypothetical protein